MKFSPLFALFTCLLFSLHCTSAQAQEAPPQKNPSPTEAEKATPNPSSDKTQSASTEDATDDQTDARARVLELAGAFSNNGYKIRDGFWCGVVEPNKPIFLEVNLFAENRYWFCAGTDSNIRKISVTLFNAEGKPLETHVYQDTQAAAAGWIADTSGNYFVRIALLEGVAGNVCFLYTYK